MPRARKVFPALLKLGESWARRDKTWYLEGELQSASWEFSPLPSPSTGATRSHRNKAQGTVRYLSIGTSTLTSCSLLFPFLNLSSVFFALYPSFFPLFPLFSPFLSSAFVSFRKKNKTLVSFSPHRIIEFIPCKRPCSLSCHVESFQFELILFATDVCL